MKFESLILDEDFVRCQMFPGCDQCEGKAVACAACTNRETFILKTLDFPMISRVVIVPKLYEDYFLGGMAPTFEILAGYIALIHVIKHYCNPDYMLGNDKEWQETSYAFRQNAKNVLTARYREMDEEINRVLLQKVSDVEIIRMVESKIIFGLAVMETKSGDEKEIETCFLKKCLWNVSTTLIDCSMERCSADKLQDKITSNTWWNDYKVVMANRT